MASKKYNEIISKIDNMWVRLRRDQDVIDLYRQSDQFYSDDNTYDVTREKAHKEITELEECLKYLDSSALYEEIQALKKGEREFLKSEIDLIRSDINKKIIKYSKDIEEVFKYELDSFWSTSWKTYEDCQYGLEYLEDLERQAEYILDEQAKKDVLFAINNNRKELTSTLEEYSKDGELVKDEDGNVISVQEQAEDLRIRIENFFSTYGKPRKTKDVKDYLRLVDELEKEVESFKDANVYYYDDFQAKSVSYYEGLTDTIKSIRSSIRDAQNTAQQKETENKLQRFKNRIAEAKKYGDYESCVVTIDALNELEAKVKKLFKGAEREILLEEINSGREVATLKIDAYNRQSKVDRMYELYAKLGDFVKLTSMGDYQECLDAKAELEKLNKQKEEFKEFNKDLYWQMEGYYDYAKGTLAQRLKETKASDVKKLVSEELELIDNPKQLKAAIIKAMERYECTSFKQLPKSIRDLVKYKCDVSVNASVLRTINPFSGGLEFAEFVAEIEQAFLEKEKKSEKDKKAIAEALKKQELKLSKDKVLKMEDNMTVSDNEISRGDSA